MPPSCHLSNFALLSFINILRGTHTQRSVSVFDQDRNCTVSVINNNYGRSVLSVQSCNNITGGLCCNKLNCWGYVHYNHLLRSLSNLT